MAELLDTLLTSTTLKLHYRFRASAQQLFEAWTQPDLLRQWFRVRADYSTPIAEVDLRVGGRYRLGMQTPEGELIAAAGEYRHVEAPHKLAFTLKWESSPPEMAPTLVTLDFIQHPESSELILRHEHFTSEEHRDDHLDGWKGCLTQLSAFAKDKGA